MNLRNLDKRTRTFMAQEVERDIFSGILYISKRFNDKGRKEYPSVLLEAVKSHDGDWLALQIYTRGFLDHEEVKHIQKEIIAIAQVPATAGLTFAEGQFNRYYMRGVCLAAIEDGVPEVVVYRGKGAAQPRAASEAMVGKRIPAPALLEDLRAVPGSRSRFGIPPGPNSGLTVGLP